MESSILKIDKTLPQTQVLKGYHRRGYGHGGHFELPSIEEITEMEKQRSKATESLEISDGHVKCQACGTLRPIITDDTKLIDSSESRRIHRLRAIIKLIERYHIADTSANKQKQELAELLDQQKKNDIFRRLPLYSSSATRYGWFCSGCYDKAYSLSRKKENK